MVEYRGIFNTVMLFDSDFFLACQDLGGRFDESVPTCTLILVFFLLEVEIRFVHTNSIF